MDSPKAATGHGQVLRPSPRQSLPRAPPSRSLPTTARPSIHTLSPPVPAGSKSSSEQSRGVPQTPSRSYPISFLPPALFSPLPSPPNLRNASRLEGFECTNRSFALFSGRLEPSGHRVALPSGHLRGLSEFHNWVVDTTCGFSLCSSFDQRPGQHKHCSISPA